MNIVDRVSRFFPWTPKIEEPEPNGHKGVGSGVQFVGNPDWRTIVRIDGDADPDAEELLRTIAFATSAYAYTAITYRATRIAQPTLSVVKEVEGEGDVKIPGHEFAMLLDEPSPDYDMGELQQLTEIYRCITGGCLWVREKDDGQRDSRWLPFSGDEFETFAFEGRIYGFFRVDVVGGQRDYLPEDVVHFRDINPNSWRRHLSKLDVALSQLDLGHQINRTVRNFMRTAMFPSGTISPDKDWNPDDDQWNEWKNEIRRYHQGPTNAGEALVLQGGTVFSRIQSSLKDMLPSELLDRIEATIGSVFGIPPVVLGWKVGLENSPWSQMSEARQMTYEDTIEPRWQDIEKKMTRQILSEEERLSGNRIAFDVSNVRAFQADDKTRAEVAGSMRQEWTRNERRIYTGKDPLPEDDERGDEIESGGMIVPEPDDEPEEEPEEEEEEELSAALQDILSGTKGVTDSKVLEWAIFDTVTKAAESTWERTVFGVLGKMRNDIVALADEHIEEKQADPDSILAFIAAVGTYIREQGDPLLAKTLIPLVFSTGNSALRRAAAQTGLSFSILQEGLLDFAEEEAAFLASVMGETTGKSVAATVQKQLGVGGSLSDIRKALIDDASFTRTRAQLVARTETTRAWNGAQRRALSEWERDQDEGVLAFKSWLDSGDSRVRPAHKALGEQDPIPINELFDNGLQQPGEPNCRCTLTYSIED